MKALVSLAVLLSLCGCGWSNRRPDPPPPGPVNPMDCSIKANKDDPFNPYCRPSGGEPLSNKRNVPKSVTPK